MFSSNKIVFDSKRVKSSVLYRTHTTKPFKINLRPDVISPICAENLNFGVNKCRAFTYLFTKLSHIYAFL